MFIYKVADSVRELCRLILSGGFSVCLFPRHENVNFSQRARARVSVTPNLCKLLPTWLEVVVSLRRKSMNFTQPLPAHVRAWQSVCGRFQRALVPELAQTAHQLS